MIRVGTIGTSQITTWFASAVAATPGIEIGCVYSRDAQRAAAFAEQLGVARASDDLDAMLRDPAIDAIYVASPNQLHQAQALAAIRAGKHVLVEKPAVPTVAEWDDLVAAAQAQGVVLFEGIRNQYDPAMDLIREILPKLGVIRRVAFHYAQRSARYDQVLAGERVNIFDPNLAGGALYDLGIYCVHALVGLFGAPARVRGFQARIASGADGAGAILAEYPEFVADLSYSKITRSSTPSEIQGEKGTLYIDHIANPVYLKLEYLDGSVKEHHLPPRPGMLHDEVARFVHLVESGESAEPDQARTRMALALVEAARNA